jgi:hypothetical protein
LVPRSPGVPCEVLVLGFDGYLPPAPKLRSEGTAS